MLKFFDFATETEQSTTQGLPQYEKPAAFGLGSDWMQQFAGGTEDDAEEMLGDDSSEEDGEEGNLHTRYS